MCLTPKHSDLRTAENDIIAVKLLRVYDEGEICSAYKTEHQWNLNKLVTVKTRLGGDKSKREIGKGLHACINMAAARRRKDYDFPDHPRVKFFKVIIPKGSVYKLGQNEDIVADKMIVVGRWFSKKK